MVLELKVLNSDAILNNFVEVGSVQFVQGTPLKLVMRMHQPQKDLRYVAEAGATLSIDFKLSDGTTLTKAGVFPFADDRSIVQFDLTGVETQTLISQNLLMTLTETAGDIAAVLQQGIQSVDIDGC